MQWLKKFKGPAAPTARSSSTLEQIEDRLARGDNLSRRSLFRRIAQGCTALLAGIAGTALLHETAFAIIGQWYCCDLVGTHWCTYNDCRRDGCPNNAYEWVCFYQNGYNQQWICGECYDCKCSYAYNID
jgi:hypothetical protein